MEMIRDLHWFELWRMFCMYFSMKVIWKFPKHFEVAFYEREVSDVFWQFSFMDHKLMQLDSFNIHSSEIWRWSLNNQRLILDLCWIIMVEFSRKLLRTFRAQSYIFGSFLNLGVFIIQIQVFLRIKK